MGVNSLRILAAGRPRRVLILAIGLGLVGWGAPVQAQYSYTTLGTTYTQNFDSTSAGLPTSTSAITPAVVGTAGTWLQLTDASIPATLRGGTGMAGWYIGNSTLANQPRLGLDTGTSSTGSIFNYATTTAGTNRALGTQGSGTTQPYIGMWIQNNTGSTLNTFTLSYDAFEFRNPATTVNALTFSYLVTTNAAHTFFTPGFSSDVAALGFTTPTAGNPGGPGTQAAQNPAISLGAKSATINGLSVANGGYLILRWKDLDESSGDAGVAIDNVSFSANVSATNAVWNTTSGDWTIGTGTNWTGATGTVFTEGDSATFGGAPVGTNTVTLNTTVNPSSVTVSATSGTYALTGTGSINGAGSLTKSNAGTLDLTGLSAGNGYTGGTAINGGTVIVSHDNQLGGAAGAVTLNGGTLSATAAITSARPLTVDATGGTLATGGNAISTTGNATLNGLLTTTGAGNVTLGGTTLTVGSGGNLTVGSGGSVTLANTSGTVNFSNGLTLQGDLVLNSTARFNFNGAITYGGPGKIHALGSALGAGSGGFSGTAFTNFNLLLSNLSGGAGGTITSEIVLNPANSGPLTGHVAFTPGNVAGANYVAASYLVFIGPTSNTAPLTINGVISGEGDVYIGNNSKTGGGSGTMVLNAASTYQGNTLWNSGGTVQIGVHNAFPTSSHLIFGSLSSAGNSTLDLNGRNQQFASLSDDAAKPSGKNLTITNQGATDSILTISGNVTPGNGFGGVIADGTTNKVSLVKDGLNTLTLAGTNSYTGTTRVSGGTLLINSRLAFDDAAHVQIDAPDDTLAGNPLLVRSVTNLLVPNNYAGLEATEVGGRGTVAQLLHGQNTTGTDTTVAMQFRQRATAEQGPTGTSPPLPNPNHGGLVSDVLSLTGMVNDASMDPHQTDLFVLQLSYDPTLLVGAPNSLYLGYLNEGTGLWENAVHGNVGSSADLYVGDVPWSNAYTTLGQWGVDTAANTVWAVLNHNSQFAAVPEPATFVLCGLAGVGLLLCRRRRNQAV